MKNEKKLVLIDSMSTQSIEEMENKFAEYEGKKET